MPFSQQQPQSHSPCSAHERQPRRRRRHCHDDNDVSSDNDNGDDGDANCANGNIIMMPLISITLCPISSPVSSTVNSSYDNNSSTSKSVMTNPLLRACIKRLLVGRKIICSPFTETCNETINGNNKAEEEGKLYHDNSTRRNENELLDSTSTTTSQISVRVPLPFFNSGPSSSFSQNSSQQKNGMIKNDTNDRYQVLDYHLSHVQCASSNNSNNYNYAHGNADTDAIIQTENDFNHSSIMAYVILPSTRIIFQLMQTEEETKEDNHCKVGGEHLQQKQHLQQNPHQLQQQYQRMKSQNNIIISNPNKLKVSPPLLPPSPQIIAKIQTNDSTSPHEHILTSLQSILCFQQQQQQRQSSVEQQEDNNHSTRPPIPRSFLFTGPPGVGKTYSVKLAISKANAWVAQQQLQHSLSNSSETAPSTSKIRLISLRGSELLSSSASSGGEGHYATAARELERQFQLAASLSCRSQGSRTNSHNYHGVPDGESMVGNNDDNGSNDGGTQAVVVFLDECDALVSSSIVAAMLALLLDKMEGGGISDTNYDGSNDGWGSLVLVAATNRIDAIPASLRRPGRLEKEIVVSPPNVQERFALLKSIMLGSSNNPSSDEGLDNLEEDNDRDRNVSTIGNFDDSGIQSVAEACVGYVAADLSALVRRAAMLRIERQFHNPTSLSNDSSQISLRDCSIINTKDLFAAMNDVGASCLRDASLSAPPKTTWNDIAGDVGGAKHALRQAIEWPRIHKSAFLALGLSPPRGVLLHGPPGCAKTTLARAAAGAAGVAFLSLSPADVYASSYVGEAEGVVRRAFGLARSAAPCVLFFDEIDSIIGGEDGSAGGGKSGHGMGRGTSAEARVLSTFLNEMDGVDGSVEDGVLVLGATNRPGTLDAALLRPGRFDRVIYVPPPDESGRKAILMMECTKWRDSLLSYSYNARLSPADSAILENDCIEKYFNIDLLANDAISGSMTGAEIVGACRETAVQVLREIMESSDKICSKSMHNSSKETVEKLMQSLRRGLETSLTNANPLLSGATVLEEYTRFDNEHR